MEKTTTKGNEGLDEFVMCLRGDICKKVEEVLDKIYNKKKEEQGLISLWNTEINDLRLLLKEWRNTDRTYLSLKLCGKGFVSIFDELKEKYPDE